jgi:putative aldouronate transport system permease protein
MEGAKGSKPTLLSPFAPCVALPSMAAIQQQPQMEAYARSTAARRKRAVPWSLHLMLIPGVILTLIYSYGPLFGIVIAFQNYIPAKGILGSEWIGLENFHYILTLPNIERVVWNTIAISTAKLIFGLLVPIFVALLLNEVRRAFVKRTVQTMIYLPYFLSWVILGGILIDILSPSSGIINLALSALGMKPIYFLGKNEWFPRVLVITDVWKHFGFNTIIYLAALTNISPTLYEAAVIDGADRWAQTRHITLPGLAPIIVLVATLSLGNILNAGFDQILTLYSPQVYQSGDVIDTFVYRLGLVQAQYGVAAAVSLFKSIVSTLLISVSYILAVRYANYRIF